MALPAIRSALELHHIPSRVRAVRLEPLPTDVETLLRIAAGETEPLLQAVSETGRSHQTIVEAAGFFIEQILLCPEANAYRILAADRDAPATELRRNMALILRWLHPDLDAKNERSIFVTRVTTAWQTLKSPERRAAYDQQLQASQGLARPNGRSRPGSRSANLPVANGRSIDTRQNATIYNHAHSGPNLIRRLALYLGSFRRS